MKIFTINPGSTSTKIALFENGQKTFSTSVSHSVIELKRFNTLKDQLPFRQQAILDTLEKSGIILTACDAFVGRGGGLIPMEGGVYKDDDFVVNSSINSANGVIHPANLGPTLARFFSQSFGGRAFVVNPPDVDEYQEVARITGVKGVYRTSHLHALNQKELGRRQAEKMKKPYEECNFIICHLGGGVSIAAHHNGKMIDGNDIVGGEGPMAPTRAGSLPSDRLIELCFSGKFTKDKLRALCTKDGGFVSLLDTSDAREVLVRADGGDPAAHLAWKAMLYQISKSIGAMASVLHGHVDGILLGGGLVNETRLFEFIQRSCGWIAPITPYPGEFEMEAMAQGAEAVLKGNIPAKVYKGEPSWVPPAFLSIDLDLPL